jgi:hypothetical protein
MRGSNPRLAGEEPVTLPTELIGHSVVATHSLFMHETYIHELIIPPQYLMPMVQLSCHVSQLHSHAVWRGLPAQTISMNREIDFSLTVTERKKH